MGRRSRVCPWCDGTGRFIRRLIGGVMPDVVNCRHLPAPAIARPRPGAEFRTTKFTRAKPKPGEKPKRLRAATPTWRAPR